VRGMGRQQVGKKWGDRSMFIVHAPLNGYVTNVLLPHPCALCPMFAGLPVNKNTIILSRE
jgi:hypothetical protein